MLLNQRFHYFTFHLSQIETLLWYWWHFSAFFQKLVLQYWAIYSNGAIDSMIISITKNITKILSGCWMVNPLIKNIFSWDWYPNHNLGATLATRTTTDMEVEWWLSDGLLDLQYGTMLCCLHRRFRECIMFNSFHCRNAQLFLSPSSKPTILYKIQGKMRIQNYLCSSCNSYIAIIVLTNMMHKNKRSWWYFIYSVFNKASMLMGYWIVCTNPSPLLAPM